MAGVEVPMTNPPIKVEGEVVAETPIGSVDKMPPEPMDAPPVTWSCPWAKMSFLTWRFPASNEWMIAEVVSRPEMS